MGSWILDMLLVAVTVLVMGFIFFKLVFSSTEETRREQALKPKPRFERREAERVERRRHQGSAPEGRERRVAARR